MAAASTLLASQQKILRDARWAAYPVLRALVVALSDDGVAVATRAPRYHDEFRAFFQAFGSTFDSGEERPGPEHLLKKRSGDYP